MRRIDCPCGHQLEAETDDELVRPAREHVDHHHRERERSDVELRERVSRDAHDV